MATVTREDRELVAAAVNDDWQSLTMWEDWVEGRRPCTVGNGENGFAQIVAELRERADRAEAELKEWREKGIFWPLHKPHEDQANHYRERAENLKFALDDRNAVLRQLADLKRELESVKAKCTPPEGVLRELETMHGLCDETRKLLAWARSLAPKRKRKTRRDAALNAYGEIHGAAHDADFVMRYVLTAAGVDPDEEIPE